MSDTNFQTQLSFALDFAVDASSKHFEDEHPNVFVVVAAKKGSGVLAGMTRAGGWCLLNMAVTAVAKANNMDKVDTTEYLLELFKRQKKYAIPDDEFAHIIYEQLHEGEDA